MAFDPKPKEVAVVSRVDQARVVDMCQQLVRFRSVNPPGDELEIATYIADILDGEGFEVDLPRHSPTRASLIARLKGTGELPALLYCGHLDVMPIGSEDWQHGTFDGELADGSLWGRGSSDMKSGLAAMIEAARVLQYSRDRLRGDLLLLFTADEEVGGLGAAELATRDDLVPAQALVICEPTYNEVIVAEKGQLWLEITTHGKAAHGSMPQLGNNAIMMMVALLSGLEQLGMPTQEHPLLGKATRNVGTIQGGLRTNVVPERCVATVDQRSLPGQDHQAAVEQVEQVLEQLRRRQPGFQATVKVVSDLAPVETPPDDPIVQQFCDVVGEIIGTRPMPRGVPYTTDAPFLVPVLNAPMIICGPGDPGLAHQPDEHVEVRRLVDSAKILTLVAARLLL